MGTQPIPLAVKGHSEIVHGSTPESPTHQRTPRARMRPVHINPGQSALQWASMGQHEKGECGRRQRPRAASTTFLRFVTLWRQRREGFVRKMHTATQMHKNTPKSTQNRISRPRLYGPCPPNAQNHTFGCAAFCAACVLRACCGVLRVLRSSPETL